MEPIVQQRILDYLARDWAKQSREHRSWAAWIRGHGPVTLPLDSIRTPLRAVWFLDRNGLQPRSTSEFLRYWAVQIDQIWFTGGFERPGSGRGIPSGIGWATFAEIDGTDEIYLETIWGGRSCPADYRVAIETDGSVVEKGSVWIG